VDARYYATLAGIGERRSRRSSAPNDLARNTFLAALHDRNEYAAIAQAAGLHSVRIEQPAEVRSALAEAMAHPDPVLIDLVTDPDVLSIPPHITTAEVKGFASWVPVVTYVPTTPLSTATVPAVGAWMLISGCANALRILMRPTTWFCRTALPSWMRHSSTQPLVGALIMILSPSICALSVLT
jgi:hypothetical protein